MTYPTNEAALEAAESAVRDLWDGNSYDGGSGEITRAALSAYLAAALPEVTSVEELRSVPVGTAFFDADADWVYQIQSNGEPGAAGRIIVSAGIEEEFTPEELKYPLQILPPARRNYDLPD